ncbi:hypothetical protein EV179_003950, partial [Coemansia sp. RSA 487]
TTIHQTLATSTDPRRHRPSPHQHSSTPELQLKNAFQDLVATFPRQQRRPRVHLPAVQERRQLL